MTKEEVSEFFKSKDYSADRFGYFIMKKNDRTYRYKIGPKSLRYEVLVRPGKWMRLRSQFYGKLKISDEGKLVGMAK